MTQKHLLIIESLSSGIGFQVVEYAIENNFLVSFVSNNMDRTNRIIPTELKNKFPIYFIPNITEESLNHLADSFDKKNPIVGVICMLDDLLPVVSRFSRGRGFKFTNPNAIDISVNKEKTRQFCFENDIQSPQYVSIENADQLKKIEKNLKFPLIVKPQSGAGSVNVKLINNLGELQIAVQTLLKTNSHVLIEEYIYGPVFSVEGFIFDDKIRILGVSDRTQGDLPHFVGYGMTFPVNLGENLNRKIEVVIGNILEKMNYQYGFFHIEISIKNGEIYLIEINPRVGGRLITFMIGIAYQTDFYKQYVNMAMGIKPLFDKSPLKGSSTSVVFPNKEGYLEHFKYEHLTKYPGVVSFLKNPSMNIGSKVSPPIDFRGHLLLLLTEGETPDLAAANARAAASSVETRIV